MAKNRLISDAEFPETNRINTGNSMPLKRSSENSPAFVNLERVAAKVTYDYIGVPYYQIYCCSSLRTICGDAAGL